MFYRLLQFEKKKKKEKEKERKKKWDFTIKKRNAY